MNNTAVTPIPEKQKDEMKAAWLAKIPAVGNKLEAAKSDSERRLIILEVHKIGNRKMNETDLLIRVGG